MSQLSLIWGMALSFFHIIIVIAALKIFKRIAPVFLHAISAMIGLGFLTLVSMVIEMQFWIAFSVVSFCVSSYLFVFGAIYKSLTLRMLCAVQRREGSTSIDQLDAIVTLPTFTARIALLNEMGRVAAEKEHYFLTEKGKKTAKFFSRIRRIFCIDTKAVYHARLDEPSSVIKE